MPEEILQKSVGIDLDGDKKPDIKVDIKSILIVGGFLISGAMSYSNLKQEIEIAKELPVVEIKQDEVVNQKIEFMQLEIEKLEKKIENIEDKVYKR
jgi:hypothetical protein|tara:strand:- start:11873 stop:12160 length:288 start_codon:yes stop_codon:yes gene_type:complete